MAGSFFHLWLAQRLYDDFWGERKGEVGIRLKGALGAGSLAPDVGLFPGGPIRFSERIHRERSGDFLRALLAAALDEEEIAFVMGWGMHLYADWTVHPWVDERAEELFARTGEGSADLWHMRVEWGVDCRLLERGEWDHLWEFPLHFPQPRGEEEILSRVGRAFYGEDADPVGVSRGEESIERWMRRLPRIFLWCGKIHPRERRALPLLPRLLNRLTEKLLGGGLAGFPAWKTESALAKPWSPQAADLGEVEGLGELAIRAFKKGWGERFASFPNRDLEKEGLSSASDDE